jgi:hypothetical protein
MVPHGDEVNEGVTSISRHINTQQPYWVTEPERLVDPNRIVQQTSDPYWWFLRLFYVKNSWILSI